MRVRLGAMLRPSSSSSSSPKGQHLSPLPQKGTKKKKRKFTKTRTTRASLQELHNGEEEIVLAVLKYFSAGGIGCFASHCLSVPLDVIKTKVQLNPELNSECEREGTGAKNRQRRRRESVNSRIRGHIFWIFDTGWV